MILAVLVVNDAGQARLVRWYEPVSDPTSLLRRVFIAVSRRGDRLCNFLETDERTMGWKKGTKIVYRHYATLYFIFIVEETESELGILDLIQVFVETLDRCFENVCELDLIFHSDRVHYVLDEVVQGGLVLETNMSIVLRGIDDMAKMERSSSSSALVGPNLMYISSRTSMTSMAANFLPPTQTVIASTSHFMEAGSQAANTLAQKASAYFASSTSRT